MSKRKYTKSIDCGYVFPKRPSTLGNKIRKQDPWMMGDILATLVENNWHDIISAEKIEELPYIIELAKKKYLDVNWMVNQGILCYLK